MKQLWSDFWRILTTKGKAHKKYEFGCKVSLVSTSQDIGSSGSKQFMAIRTTAITLKEALDHAQAITGWRPQHLYQPV